MPISPTDARLPTTDPRAVALFTFSRYSRADADYVGVVLCTLGGVCESNAAVVFHAMHFGRDWFIFCLSCVFTVRAVTVALFSE